MAGALLRLPFISVQFLEMLILGKRKHYSILYLPEVHIDFVFIQALHNMIIRFLLKKLLNNTNFL